MLLRSVSQHVKDQNWFAIFIDFFIVVVGVFIGIQVANWNEGRHNKKLAVDYINRLNVDIDRQIYNYSNYLAYFTITRKSAVSAANAFSKPIDTLNNQFLIDLYQASQRINGSSTKGIYDELLATGSINLIGDLELREKLSVYYSSLENYRVTIRRSGDYRPFIRKEIHHLVQQEIRDHCGDKLVHKEGQIPIIKLNPNCSITIDEKLSFAEIKKLHSNHEILKLLRYQIDIIDTRILVLNALLTLSQNLKDSLGTGNK